MARAEYVKASTDSRRNDNAIDRNLERFMGLLKGSYSEVGCLSYSYLHVGGQKRKYDIWPKIGHLIAPPGLRLMKFQRI
jgi:hypothetical protein